ncbi:MAG: RNA polymerase sigma factor [Firmicutes bacterium]|nr:RNA polymerase sigma factor [Bacillota bacterium]
MRKRRRLTTLLATSLRRKKEKVPKFGKRVNSAEKELVAQAKQGEAEAFRQLVELNWSKVYNLLLGMIHDQLAAQELTQEVFVKAWKKLPTFRGDSTFWTWIYRIAYHAALDELRKKKREAGILFVSENLHELIQEPANEPLEVVVQKEQVRDLLKALRFLSFSQRIALILYYFQGFSYQEIAAFTRRPLGTIRADLHRGKEKLREIISEKWGLKDAFNFY